MTIVQRVFNAFHGLVSRLNKDDDEGVECGATEGFFPVGTVDEDNLIDVFALEGDMWTFVIDLNSATEQKRVA
ncbi:hypothetical protein [Shinella zoogloeoides]|uniref:hypothetical protein n=1 Tax=Shinella zoogloeoides TaxID=352475 RepID=UPI00299F0501|nr:hypothetical protein [Shinella zoogloeoides]WPE22464.1 hypothetical protein ShzoTeo12_36800 [Shinella zoogloeoides]